MKKLLRNMLNGSLMKMQALDRFGVNSLEAFFYHTIKIQRTEWRKKIFTDTVYFEFGVASGGTMAAFARAALLASRHFNLDIKSFKIVGFDTFEGLPEPRSEFDQHSEWTAGTYAYNEEHVRKVIETTGFPLEQCELVPGLYENTLVEGPEPWKQYKPSITTIDCDYYTSTTEVLDFLSREQRLRSGCFFYFDDIWSFDGHPDMGEIKAIQEYNENAETGYLTPCTLTGHVASRVHIYASQDAGQ